MSATIEATEIEILIEGKVVKSNLDTFCAQLKGVVKSLNRELATDGDFESADKDAKFLKSAEKSLKLAKDQALKQAEDIQKLFAAIDDVSEEARQARLGLERQIKTRKEERKREIIKHVSSLVKYGFERVYEPYIESATKGKKTFESIEAAAHAELEKINAKLESSRKCLDGFIENYGTSLIPDESALLQKEVDFLEVELQRRVERAEAEAERKRLEKEKLELQKAQERAEAEAKAETESNVGQKPAQESAAPKPPTSVNPEPEPALNEMAVFKKRTLEAFYAVKEARSRLTEPKNIELAKRFADDVGAAWKKLTEGSAS